jgi:hypothetical protein
LKVFFLYYCVEHNLILLGTQFNRLCLLILFNTSTKRNMKQTPTNRGCASISKLFLLFSLVLLFALSANAQTITTDFGDYPPGSTVTITGTGWTSGEVVTVRVTHNPLSLDDSASEHQPWQIIADASGNFTTSWYVPTDGDELGASLIATADGEGSGAHAEALFTDAGASANLDQARNGGSTSPVSPVNFQNGNLSSSQAHYLEGQSVPYRVIFSGLQVGKSILFTIEYDAVTSSHQAIDYLTQYNRLLPHITHSPALAQEVVNPLDGITLGAPNTTTTYPIPTPAGISTPVAGQPATSFNSLPTSKRLMTGYNMVIDSVYYGTQANLSSSSDITQVIVKFTPLTADAVLAWGGHLASRTDWGYDGSGNPRSAGEINGSSYHMSLGGWQYAPGQTGLVVSLGQLGSQSRGLSTSSSGPPPSCGITGMNPTCASATTIYTAVTDAANPTFTWSVTGSATISGGTHGSTVNINPAAFGSFTVNISITSGTGVTTNCSETITITANPTCNISGSNSICNGQSATLTSDAADAYSWNTAEITQAITVSPSTTTTYSVTVTNGSG